MPFAFYFCKLRFDIDASNTCSSVFVYFFCSLSCKSRFLLNLEWGKTGRLVGETAISRVLEYTVFDAMSAPELLASFLNL